MKKKLFSLLLSLVMMVTMMPGMSLTAFGIEEYNLWVAGVKVTDQNKSDVFGNADEGAKISFNPSTNTLTLNNATITQSIVSSISTDAERVLPVEGGYTGSNYVTNMGIVSTFASLKIELKGTNQIGSVVDYTELYQYGIPENKENYDFWYGIILERDNDSCDPKGDLTITGNGNLTIYDKLDGILANNITFGIAGNAFSGKLTVFDEASDQEMPPCSISAVSDVIINGGTFDLNSFTSNGITAENIFINNGNLVVKGNEKAMWVAPSIASGLEITASENFDGSSPVQVYDASSIESYRYIKIKKKVQPTPWINPKTPDEETTELAEESKIILSKISAYKSGKIKLTFKGLKLKDGQKVTKYQIYRKVKGGNYKRIATVTRTKSKNTYTNTKHLKKGKKYYYKIRGVVKLSDGSYAHTGWSKVQTAKCKRTR